MTSGIFPSVGIEGFGLVLPDVHGSPQRTCLPTGSRHSLLVAVSLSPLGRLPDRRLATTCLRDLPMAPGTLGPQVPYPVWKKTSVTPFVSTGTRFVASEAKATMRPLP